jgi:hypothetical protein
MIVEDHADDHRINLLTDDEIGSEDEASDNEENGENQLTTQEQLNNYVLTLDVEGTAARGLHPA